MRFSHTVETEASPEEIWTNIDKWSAWNTELASATPDGEFAKGTSGRLRPGKGPTSTFFISELTQGELRVHDPIASVRASASLFRAFLSIKYSGLTVEVLRRRMNPCSDDTRS